MVWSLDLLKFTKQFFIVIFIMDTCVPASRDVAHSALQYPKYISIQNISASAILKSPSSNTWTAAFAALPISTAVSSARPLWSVLWSSRLLLLLLRLWQTAGSPDGSGSSADSDRCFHVNSTFRGRCLSSLLKRMIVLRYLHYAQDRDVISDQKQYQPTYSSSHMVTSFHSLISGSSIPVYRLHHLS